MAIFSTVQDKTSQVLATAEDAAKPRRSRRRQNSPETKLTWKLRELSEATGVSLPSIWRRIAGGDIKTVKIGSVVLVTRAEMMRLGLITD